MKSVVSLMYGRDLQMKLRLFTLVFGQKYLGWLERYAVPSLLWPRNLNSLQHYATGWDIYCEPKDTEFIGSICRPVGIPITFRTFENTNEDALTMHNAMVHHVGVCSDEGVAMFVVPPDTIFGEGTIYAICTVGEQPGTCVGMVHVRVSSAVYYDLRQPITNPKLVSLAFENLHPTWTHANQELTHTNTITGGVNWRNIGHKLWLVQHRLPTPYLASVNRSDITWMGQHRHGLWDHGWPEKLVNEQRWRYLGSSDAGFAVELTDMGANLPSIEPKNLAVPDDYKAEFGHHATNRCMMVTLRGE